MRELLLTWYGITDLRAALGFDTGEGPILGAVAAHPYTDVVVLGYVKADGPTTGADTFARELTQARVAHENGDRAASSRFVGRFANTPSAHQHVEAWLRARIEAVAPGTVLTVTGQALSSLNDTEGIYAGAVRSLEAVATDTRPSQVSLYLSPGTPTMAFTWAFAALAHPNVRKRLIAASDPTKPPEPVRLPAEWMERFGRPVRPGTGADSAFDVVFHLFGEQRMPTLLGIRQFSAGHHVFVASDQFSAAVMRRFTADAATSDLEVDPYDPAQVRDRILAHAATLGTGLRVGFNVTGGTKLMYAGALAAARALGATSFYFDSPNRRVVYLDGFDSEPIKPIDSVQTFLDLNGDGLGVSSKGSAPVHDLKRTALTEALWKHRNALGTKGFYKRVAAVNDEFKPFHDSSAGFTFELTVDRTVNVSGNGLDLTFPDWPEFAGYLSGGWFEEYVFARLKPFVAAGTIRDLRANLVLALNNPSGRYSRWDAFTELDVAFTDGYSLYVVECKAGSMTQEHVMKLQSLVRYYGGVDGCGVIASCYPPRSKQVARKTQDARIVLCAGDDLVAQLRELMEGIAERATVAGA